MAKANLGTKRICPTTGRKFYDLGKDPVISPYTGEIVPVAPLVARGRPEGRAAARDTENEVAETQEEAELVSLEEADAETQGGKSKKSAVADVDDIDEVDDDAIDDGDDDETFIEETEEEDTDVSEIIGGDIEKEEEN